MKDAALSVVATTMIVMKEEPNGGPRQGYRPLTVGDLFRMVRGMATGTSSISGAYGLTGSSSLLVPFARSPSVILT